MLLSIIIVSYNTSALTEVAITSAVAELKTASLLASQAEIIVVDNNSTDGSLKMLEKMASTEPMVRIIKNQDNVGFARANNQGIAQATGNYFLLLNSDTVVQPGSLASLVRAFVDYPLREETAYDVAHRGQLDRLGIVAATLCNPDGSYQAQGGSFPTLLSLAAHMLLLDDLPLIGRWLPSTQHTGKNARSPLTATKNDQRLHQQDWVGGTAMAIRREVVAEIGPLDENIFMYGEDVEFCLRARDHHWDVAVDPAAMITHIGSASSTSARAIEGELKGYLYIWAKHKPFWQQGIARWLLKAGCMLRKWLFGTMMHDQPRAAIYSQILHQL